MREKITVLMLVADPFRDQAQLELGQELRAIEHAVRQGPAGDRLEFVAHGGTRADEVRAALLRHQPRIVHFAAQGDGPAAIYLADEHGRRQAVDREALRGLLAGTSVRVVVLDGAETIPAVEALSEVADYTIGTNRRVSGGSGIGFADAFYSALATGCTVLAAFELGLSQLELEGNPGAVVPVRRIRRGVNLDATLLPRPDGGEEREGRRWGRPRTWAPARRSC